MFSVITNIYNMKTKGPTLMEFFTATGKLKFFSTIRDVRRVQHGWHATHRYDIHVPATHVSTWVHRYLHCCNDLCRARMILSVGGSYAYFAQNARCTVTTDLFVWYSNTQNDFSPRVAIFLLCTLALHSGRYVNYNKKQLTGKKMFELVLLSVQVS
jgi:hypothetical protein